MIKLKGNKISKQLIKGRPILPECKAQRARGWGAWSRLRVPVERLRLRVLVERHKSAGHGRLNNSLCLCVEVTSSKTLPRICPNEFVWSKKILFLKLEKRDFINFLISVKLCAHTAVKSFPFISWNVKGKCKSFPLLSGLSFDLKHTTSKNRKLVTP